MASIEVLDYRKDGEVEARPVTGVNITERWPISFIGAAEVRSPPPSPSAEGDESQQLLDRWAEPIRRRRRLTYRSQTAASELIVAQIATHNPTENSVIAVSDAILLSRTTAWRATRSRSDGRGPGSRLMAEQVCSDAISLSTKTSPLRANTRGCIAISFNHNSVTLASEQRQASVLRTRASQPRPKSRSSR